MRILITNPTNWPLVRRGAERFMNELAAWLARRGHDVTVVSAHPGPKTVLRDNGFVTVMHRRLWRPWMERHGILEFHMFFFTVLAEVLRRRWDVVVSCTFMDAFAVNLARPLTGTRSVFWVNGLPPRIAYFRSRSMKGKVFASAISGANGVVALSDYMQKNLADRFGRGGDIIPAPVDLENFRLNIERDTSKVVILCTAALDDRRKGGKLLMRAFNTIKVRWPEAILRISCKLTAEDRLSLLSHVRNAGAMTWSSRARDPFRICRDCWEARRSPSSPPGGKRSAWLSWNRSPRERRLRQRETAHCRYWTIPPWGGSSTRVRRWNLSR